MESRPTTRSRAPIIVGGVPTRVVGRCGGHFEARPSTLTYQAVHRMFERVNGRARTSATLRALRHTAAYPDGRGPQLCRSPMFG